MSTDLRPFPILGNQYTKVKTIPWGLIAIHEPQAIRNYGGQTLELLAKRGGLTVNEAIAVIEGRPFSSTDIEDSETKLIALAEQYERNRK